jgi:hypothetical protein
MTTNRTTSDALTDAAVDAAVVAIRSAGLEVVPIDGGGAIEVAVDDRRLEVAVVAVAYCTGQRAQELTRRQDRRSRPRLVVADRITADARATLSSAGWSWLDRRGRLHLHGPGLRVDVDVQPAQREPAPAPSSIAGRGGLTVAYWLCAHPGESVSPTKSARSLGLAPSTISTAARRLVDAGLVDDRGVGIFPELFWELAASWRPERVWLLGVPDPARHRPADPVEPIWCRSGTAAASAYGAPVVATEGGPVELYVPGPVVISIASRTYGVAQPGVGRATVAVAPVSAVVAPSPNPRFIDGWPAAPVLTVALDLAQDRARGREILESWEIDGAVWR